MSPLTSKSKAKKKEKPVNEPLKKAEPYSLFTDFDIFLFKEGSISACMKNWALTLSITKA